MSAATPQPSLIDSWQSALSSEQVAVYGYGLIGPHLTDPTQIAQARRIQQAHRERRDSLSSYLAAAGAVPAVPDPQYRPDEPVTDVASAQRLALLLEQRCGQRYRYVLTRSTVAATSPPASTKPSTGSPVPGSPVPGSPVPGTPVPGTPSPGNTADADVRRRALAGLSATALAAATWRALVQPGAASVAFPGQ